MRIARLKLANVRAIKAAEFRFQPGFNLVVGVNGVGKTTVLDSLVVCLSAVVRKINKLQGGAASLNMDDIRMGADALDVECEIEGDGENASYGYAVHKNRESTVPREEKSGIPREEVHDTHDKTEFVGRLPLATEFKPGDRPLAIFFSTNRAAPTGLAPSQSAASGGIPAAFAGALSKRRGLHLMEFKDWMRVQESLRSEQPKAVRALDALRAAITRFLPEYQNFRLGGANTNGSFLQIDRGAATLPIELLSDGERGVLGLMLDLTRRLALANPELDDPAAEAEAVVLIDEIELHLHPAWQRRIVKNLTETFPKCQFIATTHSPQVIGEVKHDRITIIADGEVYSPPYSYGVDSSRILDEIMDTGSRTESVKNLLAKISRAVGDDRHDEARSLLSELTDRLGDNDPEVTRIRTLIDFMTGDA